MLEFITDVGNKYRVKIGNIFHAGDGNLHPIILYDPRDRDESRRMREAALEILNKCIAMGGSVTGEHGVGLEKIDLMPVMFSPDDLDTMRMIKGVFNSEGLLNPGKVLPAGKVCGELRGTLPGGGEM